MNKRTVLIGIAVILLASCSPETPADRDVEFGTGAILDVNAQSPTRRNEATEKLLQKEAEEAAKETYVKMEDALHLSYQNAVRVRDVMRELIPDLDPRFRKPMEEALNAFSDELAEFGDLVDIAQGRPLTPEEQTHTIELSATIEEGMETFAQIVEMIP